jgi:chemotaxis protein methyltransferase WspC
LEQARQLADEGEFEEALRCCQQHLHVHPQSVEAHYLAGLVCDASGRGTQAREYYRRTLYLDPVHHEALIHLAETLRSAGDTQGAQQLLERARRAQSRGRTA